MDRDLMVQIDTLARDRRLDRDRIIEIALRNLLSLHDWPASRQASGGAPPLSKRVAATRPRGTLLDPAEVDSLGAGKPPTR
jgi:hypothetical protein